MDPHIRCFSEHENNSLSISNIWCLLKWECLADGFAPIGHENYCSSISDIWRLNGSAQPTASHQLDAKTIVQAFLIYGACLNGSA